MIIGFSLLSDVLKLCCCALKRRQGAVERCLHLTWLEREAWGVKCWLQLTKAHKRCFLYLNILCESWDIRYWFTRQPLERTGHTAVLSQCWQVYWSHNGLCLYGYFFSMPFHAQLETIFGFLHSRRVCVLKGRLGPCAQAFEKEAILLNKSEGWDSNKTQYRRWGL